MLQSKPFLLITGMHRSGTSFLARAFNLMGVYLGHYDELISTDWQPSIDNMRGNWENKKFFSLTEQTLQQNNGTWENIPEKIFIDDNLGLQIKKNTEDIQNNGLLAAGIKDPRLIFCLESWEQYLPEKFVIVGIFRNPLEVAESLKKRNNFNLEKSIKLWKVYNQKLLELLAKHPSFLLNFNWPKEKLLSEIYKISNQLGLGKKIALEDWYTESLIHNVDSVNQNQPLDSEINSIKSQLEERSLNIPKDDFSVDATPKDLFNIIENLLLDSQKNGIYFKKTFTENNKKIEKFQKDIARLENSLKDKGEQLSTLQNSLKGKEEQLSSYVQLNSNLQKVIQDIHNSKSWKILRKFESF